jgi:hypothetical protein
VSFVEYFDGRDDNLAPNTGAQRKQLHRNHVVAALGAKMKTTYVQAIHLPAMIRTLRAKGLAPVSIRVCFAAKSGMFAVGVRVPGSTPHTSFRELVKRDVQFFGGVS